MKNKGKYFLFFILFANSFFAQFNPGAKQIALCNSDVALSNDVFSIFSNPSGLSHLNQIQAGIFYSPAPFGLKELSNGFMAFNLPLSFGNVGFGVMTYGFELYRENKFLFGYGNKFFDNFYQGIAIEIHSVSIKNYGSDISISLNAGGLIYLNEKIRWGFALVNLNRATFGKEKNQIPITMNTGFSYDLLKNVTMNLSLEKEINFTPSLQYGINYDIIKYISIRCGFSTSPQRFAAGIGINYLNFNFDYSLFNNQDLGLTHQFGFLATFSNK